MLILILLGSGIWLGNRPYMRVSTVRVQGADELFAEIARAAMRGTYFGLIPRDSIFFVPEHAIRMNILTAHSEVAAVSISRDGLTGITIAPSVRVPAARWCGLSKTPEAVPEYCYFFDASGFIFASADTAPSTSPLHPFTIYGKLAGDTEEPLRATLADAHLLPAIFDFARQLSVLGGTVTSITIRGDEVDCGLASGTRITYVRGEEEQAFAALTSAKNNLNLSDGSIDYADLRFEGKVYVKRKGAGGSEQ